MRPRSPFRDESGSATTQAVVVFPAVMLVVLLVLQFAVYQHASHVVTAAAQHGATATQGERASATVGEQAAWSFLRQADSGLLVGPDVDVVRGANVSHVVVSAHVVALVPGLSWLTVRGEADGPVERFYSSEER